MDFRSEASAIVVRLGTAAPHTHMGELAFICATSMLLEFVADLVFMELLVKIRTKLEREFQNKIKILGSLTFA